MTDVMMQLPPWVLVIGGMVAGAALFAAAFAFAKLEEADMTIAWPRWLRSRKSDADQSAEICERFFADMRDGGWHPWMYDHPRSNEPVEVTRYEWWPDVMVWRPLEIHPQTNVAGLYWRPLGNVIDVTPSNARLKA